MDDVFVELQPVGHGHQVGELKTQFVLRRRHLVVMLLRLHAEFAHHLQHLAAQILRGVDRIDREVAALGPGPMAHVALGVDLAGVVRQLDRVEPVAGVVRAVDQRTSSKMKNSASGPK